MRISDAQIRRFMTLPVPAEGATHQEIANSIARDPSLNAALGLSTAVVAGVLVTAATLVIAVSRLASFSLKGEPA
jgi:hypothetical protein